MGEVYRAQETRLNRDVALKVLPAEVANDPSRRARLRGISPNGTTLAFSEVSLDYDIASVDLATGRAERALATQRSETMPAWAAHQPMLVFISDRNGAPEIWIRKQGGERPATSELARFSAKHHTVAYGSRLIA